ncbi:hypothetical protein [Raoultella sp. 10-1]|uniref:hypothetical protein n=1 Tax=Raoultella sp. 10-1 TaxID=2683201 RepID=UPI001670C09F|nr:MULTISPECIES: hypothetical protein [Enterobacteriaceae]
MNIIRTVPWDTAHHGNIYAESYRNHKIEKASGYKESNPIMKVRTTDARALEGLIAKLYKLQGVTSAKTFILLSTYLERTIQPEHSPEIGLSQNVDK